MGFCSRSNLLPNLYTLGCRHDIYTSNNSISLLKRNCGWRVKNSHYKWFYYQYLLLTKLKSLASRWWKPFLCIWHFTGLLCWNIPIIRFFKISVQVASEKGLFSIVFNLQVSYSHNWLIGQLCIWKQDLNYYHIFQVPGSTHYSMIFYFVMKELVPGSLLQRFVDGDDEFRNSRLKLIPSVPKVECSYLNIWVIFIFFSFLMTFEMPLNMRSSFLDKQILCFNIWPARLPQFKIISIVDP